MTENPNNSTTLTQKEIIEYEIQTWKTTIEVQQHFNNLEMQVRNFAVTVLAAVIGAAGLVLPSSVGSAKLILLAGFIAWIAFYLMDRFWYHPLLLASVGHAADIEERIKNFIPGITLSDSIKHASPTKLWKFEIHSSTKMNLFYGLIAIILLLLVLFV